MTDINIGSLLILLLLMNEEQKKQLEKELLKTNE